MAADTQDKVAAAQETVDKKLAAWQVVQKVAAAKHPELANAIMAISDKNEWVRFVTEHLQDFKGSEDKFASVEDYEKTPVLEVHPETETLSHQEGALGNIAALPLVAVEAAQEIGRKEEEAPKGFREGLLKPLANMRMGGKPLFRQGILSPFFSRKKSSTSNKAEVRPEKKKSFLGKTLSFGKKGLGTYYKGQDKARTFRSFFDFFKDAAKAKATGGNLEQPLTGLLKRELPGKIPGVRKVTKTINFVNDTVKLYRRVRNVINFINEGGLSNIVSGIRNIFSDSGIFGEGGFSNIFSGVKNVFNGLFKGGGALGEGGSAVGGATEAASIPAGAAELGATGGGIIAALPEILMGLLIFIIIAALAILLFLLIKWVYFEPHAPVYDPYANAAQCGYDFPKITLPNILNELYVQESIATTDINNDTSMVYTYNQNGANSPEEYKPSEKILFNTICLLYGRTPDKYDGQVVDNGEGGANSTSKTDYINSFGKLFLGTTTVTAGKILGNTVHLVFTKDQSANCSVIKTFKDKLKNNQFTLQIINPGQCIDDGFASQLKFLIARNFGLALYTRIKNGYKAPQDPIPQALKDKVNAFDTVFNQNKGNLLPTTNCSTTGAEDECFADMVGEYMVFPHYFDGNTTPPSDSTCDETANPHKPTTCPTITPTPLPTGTPKTFAEEFTNGKYKPFYDYAKTNLFDGAEFYGYNAGPTILDKAQYIQDHLHTTCWQPWNPVETGDMYDKLYPRPLPNPQPLPSQNYVVSSDDEDRNYCRDTKDKSDYGRYWCTYLVYDSYNLAADGKQLVPQSLGMVEDMNAYFLQQASKPNPTFIYLNMRNASDAENKKLFQQIKPGFAVFYRYAQLTKTEDGTRWVWYYHTGLVKKIDVDKYGNGQLVTTEANGFSREGHITVSNGKVIGNQDFGGVTSLQ